MSLVWAEIPPPTMEQRRKGIELALLDVAKNGVTSVQDNSAWEDFLVYDQLRREGKITLRIAEWLRFNDPVKTLIQQRAHHPSSDAMLHTTQLKGFMDGSLGSGRSTLGHCG